MAGNTLPDKLNEILRSNADRIAKAARITEAIRIAGGIPFSQTGPDNNEMPDAAFPLFPGSPATGLRRRGGREAAPRDSLLNNVFVKTGYRWVGLYDVDLKRHLVANISWSGPAAPAYPTFPTTKGLTSKAIAEKRTINVGDVANDPAYLTALDRTQSEIIIPILDKTGTVVGTLDVESEQPDAFDPATQAVPEECARLLAAFWHPA